jgi:hypothetical protein
LGVALGFVIPAAVVRDREDADLHLVGEFSTVTSKNQDE